MRRLLLIGAAALLAGCGYVGDPLPPALHIPQRVSDLAVVQRGGNLVITWTAPALTTEDLEILRFDEADLRIGPAGSTAGEAPWLTASRRVSVPLPKPGSPVELKVPVSGLTGRRASIAVRHSSERTGRFSDWSPAVELDVGEPLLKPALRTEQQPGGIRLSWTLLPGAMYRVYRHETGQPEPKLAASVSGPSWTDPSVQMGREYHYSVIAAVGKRESEPSEIVAVTRADLFPPAAPSGLQAIRSANAVELVWERNQEPDFAHYRIFRAEDSQTFSVLADVVDRNAFSDRQVQAGSSYSYQVSAVDRSGNESERSDTVKVPSLQ